MGNETDKYCCPTTQKHNNLSVEKVYNKEELSMKLVVKDHNADMYRFFHSCKEFWEFNDRVSKHLRSFSEVVYGDLPQSPRIHVEFSLLNKLSGMKIINLLRPILDGMLEIIRTRYSGKSAMSNSLKDFVIMDEYGQNRHGYWTNNFHIQATSFVFTDYKVAKKFTCHVHSSLPVEKISHFSQFLGTNVDIHKNKLFIKKFLDLDCIVPSMPIADRNTKNICDQSTNSVQSISPNTHENTNIKDPHNVVSYHENGFDQRTSLSVEQGSQTKVLVMMSSQRIHIPAKLQEKDQLQHFCLHKIEITNWETIIVSMIALDRGVMCIQSTNEAKLYGCIPHKVIAITSPCHSYQFNPP
ncbi:hypothetical protein C1646_775709 [Rhizophagus diaphanus]|nr:hypothetical protein C1646_775709 [Rhizophagus diaphanus] [Rhizophagus sp. MUCL 43196]